MITRYFCLLAAIAAMQATSGALAQERPPEVTHEDVLADNPQLTLRDVLEKTFIRYPEQARLQARQAMVRARDVQASSTLPAAPAVSLSHQNDTLGSGRGERDWQAEVELPVWLPEQRQGRRKVADASQTEWASSQESLKLQVAGLLRDAVWDIALNKDLLTLAQQKLETARGLQTDVEKRYQAGELARTDFMLAEQETLAAEKLKLRAEAEFMHAKHRYSVLTGLHELPAAFAETQSTLADYSQSPLWQESEARLSLAQNERDLTNIERRENPQLLLNARSQQGPFDNAYNNSLGFKVRIPLDSEVRSAPLRAAAEQVVGDALTERERLRFTLDSALHEAEHNLEVSRAELALAEKQRSISRESLRLARLAFKLGESDLVSLLRVEAQSFEVERAYSNRQIQLQWDIARYNQAVGVLP